VTISGGVAWMPAPDIFNEQKLVSAADEALYRAKHDGRNRIILHDAPAEKSVAQERAVEGPPDLRQNSGGDSAKTEAPKEGDE